MNDTVGRQKIAILGGGIGALTTAFELTNDPGWKDRFDITIYQIGWRLGGKCASSRGANGRIEEHGIHGFLGSYFNALPTMQALYKELGRKPGEPLATFEEAFLHENYELMWEWRNGGLQKWNNIYPERDNKFPDKEDLIGCILPFLSSHLEGARSESWDVEAIIAVARRLLGRAIEDLSPGALDEIIAALEEIRDCLRKVPDFIEQHDVLRHAFIYFDYVVTLLGGYVRDDIQTKGFDSIDDRNWSGWLKDHGADPMTVASPLAMALINITYQYPAGDTSRAPQMAAGAYLHWNLRTLAYVGSSIWMFASGTGETVIAPFYLVLKARGVKFEFFQKVEALHLSEDKTHVDSVRIAVQATLKDPSKPYDPIISVKGLPGWPKTPFYDKLNEGDALKAGNIDLESYWTQWQPPGHRTLKAGEHFDKLIFAISIGAVPFLCEELMHARPETWGRMVDALPAFQSQALQIWLSKDLYELGWKTDGDGRFAGHDTVVAANYICPPNGLAEFRHLLKWEDWPDGSAPKSLWYFCGLTPEQGKPPPFDHTDYPARELARVRTQFIQYLQAGMGALLPNSSPNAQNPPGDPIGFDFGLLVDSGGSATQGPARIDSQFFRANIDPTERYVTSPPGSTRYRLKAWDTGFSNLVVAGDWIYTGLNVGSVECAVMSGKLASYAISGAPLLNTVIGYPAPPDVGT